MSIIELAGNIEDMEEFEPLPDGLYPAECQDAEVRFSEKMPQGYIYAQYRISPDHFPNDYDKDNAPEGLTVVYSRTGIIDPANRRSVKPFRSYLKAHGVKAEGNTFDPQSLVGKTVQLLLKTQEYQGAPVNNVEAIQQMPDV